jgi:hypothetical protein
MLQLTFSSWFILGFTVHSSAILDLSLIFYKHAVTLSESFENRETDKPCTAEK